MIFLRNIHVVMMKWSWKLYLCGSKVGTDPVLCICKEMLKIQLEITQATWFKPEIGSDFKVDPDLWRGLAVPLPENILWSSLWFRDRNTENINPVSQN